jgi:predicted RNase H-like HicB family nuclease
MAIPDLRDFFRWMVGQGKKPKSAFKSEKEAYEFCVQAYAKTGGITPDLKRAYEFYLQNIDDDCRPTSRRPQG